MKDIQVIEEFERSWDYTRKMTTTFINCVPADKWDFTHHSKFAPLCKQFFHMAKVYGCYIGAFSTLNLDLSKKNSHFSGHGTRGDIQAALEKLDSNLKAELIRLKGTGLEGFQVNVFGIKMGFTEYTHVMIQHEVSHFGIWTNYAAFGGFETPTMWQEEWKL